MPTTARLEADVMDEIRNESSAAWELLQLDPSTPPEDVVYAIDRFLADRRAAQQEIERDDVLALGVLLGEQYVRGHDWHWTNLTYPDGTTAFAVTNALETMGNQPMNWVFDIAQHPDREISLMLNYNMIAIGNAPAGAPGDPAMFH